MKSAWQPLPRTCIETSKETMPGATYSHLRMYADEPSFVRTSGWRADRVFTYLDKTVKRFTERQAYEHAAMVIRTRNGLDVNHHVFIPGTYDSCSEELTLTMQEFSDIVDNLTWNR